MCHILLSFTINTLIVTKKFLLPVFLILFSMSFGQQTKEFKEVKKYYDYQRFMLNSEFKKRFDKEVGTANKLAVKSDFNEFMLKLDGIQNTALVNALVKIKIQEDVKRLRSRNTAENPGLDSERTDRSGEVQYPGGFDLMRNQIIESFYTDAVLSENKTLKTNLEFIIEKDGSISSVKAHGDNITFNRQAEIALYMLPEKFQPAYSKGTAVRHRFQLPLAINIE